MPTSIITNIISGPVAAVSGVEVTARLRRGFFTVDQSSELAGYATTTSDVAGAWSLRLERQSNLLPAGSWWEIEEAVPDSQGGPRQWAISVPDFNTTLYGALLATVPPEVVSLPTPTQGPLASRPAPGVEGALYFATDARFMFYDDGTQWTGLTDHRFDMRLFGVVADGSDEIGLAQAAVDACFAAAGGYVWVPWFDSMDNDGYIGVGSPLIMRPGVSLLGDPRSPLIRNIATTGGAGTQECILPGNFHPDFTEDLTYYACGTVAPGYSVTLTNAGNASHFSVGQQVFLASTTGFTPVTWFVPDYGFCNVVTGISGGTITFKYPIDVGFANGRLAPLGAALGRNGIPLFFWENAVCSDLTFATDNYTWSNDSATLNVEFNRIVTKSDNGLYGNTFQHTKWNQCRFFFNSIASEVSHNSLHMDANDCDLIYYSDGGAHEGATIHERSRHVHFNGGTMNLNAYGAGGILLRTQDSQDCGYHDMDVSCASATFNSSVYRHDGSAQAAFPSFNNVAERCTFDLVAAGIFVDIFGLAMTENHGNGVQDCVFTGTNTGGAIRLVDSVADNFVRRNQFAAGNALFTGTNVGNLIEDNHIPDGFISETGSVDADYELNFLKGNTSTKWRAKRLVRYSSHIQQNIGVGATADFYSANIGTNIVPRDQIDMAFHIEAVGSTNTRTVTVYIHDTTTAADTNLFTFTIPAASTGRCSLTGSMYYRGNGVWVYDFVGLNTAAGTLTPFNGTVTVGTGTDSLVIRAKAASGGGDTQVNIYKRVVDISNPYYAAA